MIDRSAEIDSLNPASVMFENTLVSTLPLLAVAHILLTCFVGNVSNFYCRSQWRLLSFACLRNQFAVISMPLELGTSDLIATAGVLAAAAIAFYFYKRGLHRKRLSFAVDKKTLVFRTRDYPSELKLIYGGHEIEQLIRCTVFAWNTGNQPILRSDLDTTVPLAITISGVKRVLQGSIGCQSRTTNNVGLLDDLIVKFDYLNVGDGFVVDIFVEAENANSIEIKLDGEMIGANQMPVRGIIADYEASSEAKSNLVRLMIPFFVAVGLYYAYPTTLFFVVLLVAVAIVVLNSLMFVVSASCFGNSVPAHLIFGENGSDRQVKWKWKWPVVRD